MELWMCSPSEQALMHSPPPTLDKHRGINSNTHTDLKWQTATHIPRTSLNSIICSFTRLEILLVSWKSLFYDSTNIHQIKLNTCHLGFSTCADLQAAWKQAMAWRRNLSDLEAWLLVSDHFRVPWKINRERCKKTKECTNGERDI